MSAISQKRNSVQISLLRLFDKKMTKRELDDLHNLLINYYDNQIGSEAEKIMREKGYSQADLDKILNQQQRTKV